jgi:glyoxylase-like metal-dependent hydrolase (beta-lactamase superfamily II)
MEIFQVKTRLSNSYVVAYPERILVVDVAIGADEYVLGFIAHDLGRDTRDVSLVVCSHDDRDHIGGVFRLAVATRAAVGIPYAARAPLRKLRNDPAGSIVRTATSLREMFRSRAREMYANPRRDAEARARSRLTIDAPTDPPRRPDHVLKHGHVLPGFDDWRVIHTPGHSWDSVCFYHPASASLITGDTLLGSGPRNQVRPPAILSNPWQLRRSLRRLAELPVRAVYPGHGSPIIGEDVTRSLAPAR